MKFKHSNTHKIQYMGQDISLKSKWKTHDLIHNSTFSAHTINCVCHSNVCHEFFVTDVIRSMFRVLGTYNFEAWFKSFLWGKNTYSWHFQYYLRQQSQHSWDISQRPQRLWRPNQWITEYCNRNILIATGSPEDGCIIGKRKNASYWIWTALNSNSLRHHFWFTYSKINWTKKM